ncbi:hypothetical protein FACS189449_11740 [Alphaproteobacteria bacterium]|nr:hypothetical protein FACS189449_11740 [Alphaproteobacteria bacterium]
MCRNVLFRSITLSLLLGCVVCVSEVCDADSNFDTEKIDVTEIHDDSEGFDGFLNIKAAHERKNQYAFGPKNASAVALTPVVTFGNFTIESDFYYGHQFTYNSVLGGKLKKRPYSLTNKKYLNKMVEEKLQSNTNEANFYRSYSRLTYTNKSADFRVVVGDTSSKNTIGYQQGISGLGISIFRQEGNGNVINNGSGIVITRLSKIECRLGDDILAIAVLAPGVYSIDDLPEEAKIPGAYLKVSDQLSRNDVLKIDYFGGYGALANGKDDFDIIIAGNNRWDVDDPHRIKYNKKLRYGVNYRYGVSDEVTVGAGAQLYEGSCLLDYTTIFTTGLGMISPHVSYSHQKWGDERETNAFGAGLFYKLPKNETGISLEVFFGVKVKGFGDLDKKNEEQEEINKFFERFGAGNRREISSESNSQRLVTARVYIKPILDITPTFTFNGAWSKTERLREYTLSLSGKIFDFATLVASAGLTYDDPDGGKNGRAPDRRLTIACTIPLGSDLKIGGTYFHHDEERLRSSAKINYKPSEIKGLEIEAERQSRPGFSNPSLTVKYDGDYVNLKAEEKINNSYDDGKHDNQQRFFFGTSITTKGIKSMRMSNINVLRTAREALEK